MKAHPNPASPTNTDASGCTVFLLEDDEAQRELIKLLLESLYFQVKAYASAREFLDDYDPWQPGCLVSDIVMPGMTGLDMQETMLEGGINIPIVFITAHGDVPMAKTALKKGAVDFLEKPISTVELLESVQQALKKDAVNRKNQREAETISAQVACLTGREREVLDLLVAGRSNKELAKELNLSPRTVETHRNNILKKMRVNSFPELLRKLLSSPAY